MLVGFHFFFCNYSVIDTGSIGANWKQFIHELRMIKNLKLEEKQNNAEHNGNESVALGRR